MNIDIKLERVCYYKAPHHKRIAPKKIPLNHEYLELLTDGEVYFGEGADRKAYGCGYLFWHIPGDMTVHDNNPEFPYQCLALLFKTGDTAQRHAPRCSCWNDKYEVRKFAFTLLRSFLANTGSRELLGNYAYFRLLWEAMAGHQAAQEDKLPPSLRKALTFIKNNYGANISVEEIAEDAGLSAAHLFLLFRKHLESSPHVYLNSIRLTEAKQLLVKENNKVKEICYKCGFENIESFCRAFKKHAGLPPGQYKKKASIINF